MWQARCSHLIGRGLTVTVRASSFFLSALRFTLFLGMIWPVEGRAGFFPPLPYLRYSCRLKFAQLVSLSEDKLRKDVACKVNNMANGNAKPVKKIKVGAIDAAVWKNTIKQAKSDAEIVSLSVTMERRYKDQDGEWQGTNSYRINDIPKAVLALQKAYEFIAMEAGHLEGESANDNGDSA